MPDDVVADESEVWKAGDQGTLVVAAWWARQQGLRGQRAPRRAAAPLAGAPIELPRKAARRAPPPVRAPAPAPGSAEAPEAAPRPRKRRKKQPISRPQRRKLLAGVDPRARDLPRPPGEDPALFLGAALPQAGPPLTWGELATVERERAAPFRTLLRSHGLRAALALAAPTEAAPPERPCPVKVRLKDLLRVGRADPHARAPLPLACAHCLLGRNGWICPSRLGDLPITDRAQAARANLTAWYQRLCARQGTGPQPPPTHGRGLQQIAWEAGDGP